MGVGEDIAQLILETSPLQLWSIRTSLGNREGQLPERERLKLVLSWPAP